MKKINIPVLTILFAFITGILIYENTIQNVKIVSFIGIFSFLCLLTFHRIALKKSFSELPFFIGIGILFSSLGYIISYKADVLNDKHHYTYSDTSESVPLIFSIKDQLKPTLYQDKFVVELQSLNGHYSSGNLLLNIHKDSLTSLPKIGQWYHLKTKIAPLPFPKNPYQFDYGTYLKRKQIYGQLTIHRDDMIISEQFTNGLKVWSSRFRESIQNKLLDYSFTDKQLGIINALLLGQKQGIESQLSKDYAAAGMMHILAVSGLHVGIILLLLRFFTRLINGYKLRWVRSALIIILIWSFALLTGLSPSVLRAATMFSFLEIGNSLGGRRSSKDAVLVSGLALLIYDPILLYQVGFQLSYMAVMAILWIQPWLYSFYKPRYKLDKLLWGTATVTIAAQLGVMPLSLFYFHQFPGLFFISNIVILPFLTIVLSLGILVVTLAYLWTIPEFMVQAYGFLIDTMNNYIEWVASQESFVIKHITISFPLLITSYLAIIGTIHLLKKYSRLRLWVASATAIFFIATVIYERHHPETPHLAVLNKNRSSLLTVFNNQQLKVFNNDITSSLIENDSRITAYQDGTNIKKISIDSIRNYFRFKQKEILVIDSLGIYKLENISPDYIVLTQSPKVNLKRLISSYPKASIIADASNYKNYVQRWRITCLEQNIPFHSTYEKGAFIID